MNTLYININYNSLSDTDYSYTLCYKNKYKHAQL